MLNFGAVLIGLGSGDVWLASPLPSSGAAVIPGGWSPKLASPSRRYGLVASCSGFDLNSADEPPATKPTST